MAMKDFTWKWNAAYGNDSERLRQIRANNMDRIAELKAELAQLEGASANDLTDMDILDLELASNRANAYDMNGATTALGRIDSRMTNRAKERLDAQKNQQLNEEQNYLKIADLQDKIRQLQIKRSQAKLSADKDFIDSQIQNLATQLETLGGTYEAVKYPGKDANKVLGDYYSSTANTKNGRVFIDSVTADKRTQLVQDLLDIGEYEKAAEVEKMMTPAEKKDAKEKWAKTKKDVKKSVAVINKVIAQTAQLTGNEPTYNELQALKKKAEADRDSLVRNYGNLVKIENGELKYYAKD